MHSYISREQDYALRITACLAGLKTDEQLSINQLSERLFISKNFAARIVHKLKHGGIINTKQGVRGGVFIKRNPSELTVYEVLDTIGFKVLFNKCFSESFKCDLICRCKFHSFFEQQEQILLNNLKNRFISEFVFDEERR